MAGRPRKDNYEPDVVGVYHCYSRCVQAAFLCGVDERTGIDYSYRKAIIEQRTAWLAGIFAIDMLDFALMDNHMHHLLRVRPDISLEWSNKEVAHRWWRLHPKRKDEHGRPRAIRRSELNMLLKDPLLPEYRKRLCNMSWFMQELKFPLARKFNTESGWSGHFFDGRFKSVRLCDDAAVLACSIYMNLNWIRALKAETPEGSRYTSAWLRIRGLLQRNGTAWKGEVVDETALAHAIAESSPEITLAHPSDYPAADAWLAPLFSEGEPANRTAPQCRASNDGFLPVPLPYYLKLLDATGREMRPGKRGKIPDHLAPILQRLGLNAQSWLEVIRAFEGWFPRAIGNAAELAHAAAAAGQKWFQGAPRCRKFFG